MILLPHGESRIHLNEVITKRTIRQQEERARREHLAGRLPRPPREEENPDLPYEYDPDEPWMYNRWKEKPKLRVWYDDDGIAHKIEPGSLREAQAIKEEEELAKIRAGTLGEAAGGRADRDKLLGASELDNDDNYMDTEEGRMSSMEEGRMSSIQDTRRSSA